VQAFEYDANRGWLKRTYMNKGTTNIADIYYTRNAKGMLTGISTYGAGVADPDRSWIYGYDGQDRLYFANKNNTWAAGSVVYSYDAADNMTYNSNTCWNATNSPNMVYPAAGQPRPHAPISICGTAVTYDANGNTTSYDVDGAGPLLPRSLGYDGENRLVAITQNANTTYMVYGADGGRELNLQSNLAVQIRQYRPNFKGPTYASRGEGWATQRGVNVLQSQTASMQRMLAEIRLESTCNPARGGVYAMVNRQGKVDYVGRATDIQSRRSDHRSDPKFAGYTFKEIAQTDVYAEQRGLEQRNIDRYGAQSVTGRPSFNRIEGVSPRNPNAPVYDSAASAWPE
jgi:hypothetical protein